MKVEQLREYLDGLIAEVRGGFRSVDAAVLEIAGAIDRYLVAKMAATIRPTETAKLIKSILSSKTLAPKVTPGVLVSFFKSKNMFDIYKNLGGGLFIENYDINAFTKLMENPDYSNKLCNFFVSALSGANGPRSLAYHLITRTEWHYTMFRSIFIARHLSIQTLKKLMEAMIVLSNMGHSRDFIPALQNLSEAITKDGTIKIQPDVVLGLVHRYLAATAERSPDAAVMDGITLFIPLMKGRSRYLPDKFVQVLLKQNMAAPLLKWHSNLLTPQALEMVTKKVNPSAQLPSGLA